MARGAEKIELNWGGSCADWRVEDRLRRAVVAPARSLLPLRENWPRKSGDVAPVAARDQQIWMHALQKWDSVKCGGSSFIVMPVAAQSRLAGGKWVRIGFGQDPGRAG
jgi:hypothetical protein